MSIWSGSYWSDLWTAFPSAQWLPNTLAFSLLLELAKLIFAGWLGASHFLCLAALDMLAVGITQATAKMFLRKTFPDQPTVSSMLCPHLITIPLSCWSAWNNFVCLFVHLFINSEYISFMGEGTSSLIHCFKPRTRTVPRNACVWDELMNYIISLYHIIPKVGQTLTFYW